MPLYRTLIAASVAGLMGFAGAAQAADGESHQSEVIACLSKMDAGTTWDQCRTKMFEPCAEEEVGSEPHLACLEVQNKAWQDQVDASIAELNTKLTPDATGQLNELLDQWFGYLKGKCEAVATEKAGISAAAAGLGCEISEFAGLATEFNSCLIGKSESPYCELKKE
ncbi:MAG: hypothetical protein KC451_08795 [Amylibacter sp.]|jgi:hypothetical protein|nr:hypothetical protein [Amylibacter sp.]